MCDGMCVYTGSGSLAGVSRGSSGLDGMICLTTGGVCGICG